jgi:hypothetical protein
MRHWLTPLEEIVVETATTGDDPATVSVSASAAGRAGSATVSRSTLRSTTGAGGCCSAACLARDADLSTSSIDAWGAAPASSRVAASGGGDAAAA